MEIRYKKSANARVSVPVEIAHAAIEATKNDDGDVNVQKLVDDARPKNASLHNEFEWKNAVAGNNWRLLQGRKIVGSIELVKPDVPPVRAYHSVEVIKTNQDDKKKTSTKRVFRSTEDIMKDPESRADLLRQAISDAVAFRQRYAALQEFSQVFAVIDDIAKQAIG